MEVESEVYVHNREGEKMKNALQFHSNQLEPSEEDAYATTDDFQQLFAREMADLFHLSLLLTVRVENAESCLILAMRECFANSTVPKERALSWARQAVIRSAIRWVLKQRNTMPNDICSEAEPDCQLQLSDYRIDALRDSLAILTLPDFDRLVFVICVLERYAVRACGLLLNRSPQDIDYARVRAINHVVFAEERNLYESTSTIPTNPSKVCGIETKESSDS
jgi:hypothetical protein